MTLCPILLKDTQYRALLLFIVRDRDEALEIPSQFVVLLNNGVWNQLTVFKLVLVLRYIRYFAIKIED